MLKISNYPPTLVSVQTLDGTAYLAGRLNWSWICFWLADFVPKKFLYCLLVILWMWTNFWWFFKDPIYFWKTLKMRITNIRRGRIFRVSLCLLVIIPLLYLLFSWSETRRINPSVEPRGKHAALTRQRTEKPELIVGKFEFILDLLIYRIKKLTYRVVKQ